MKKIEKLTLILLTILEVLFLAGAYVIHYFAKKKMGMARYVSFKNYGWEDKYPMEMLIMICVIILIVLSVFICIAFFRKRKKMNKQSYAELVFMAVLIILYLYFSITSSTELVRTYYFLSGMYGAAAFLQIIKTGIRVIK